MCASVEIDTNWTVLLLRVVVGLRSLFKISYLLLVSDFLLSYKDILWYNQINGTRILCSRDSLVFVFFISTHLKTLSPAILDGGTEIWIRQAYITQLVYLGAQTQSDHNIVWGQLTGGCCWSQQAFFPPSDLQWPIILSCPMWDCKALCLPTTPLSLEAPNSQAKKVGLRQEYPNWLQGGASGQVFLASY